MATRLTVRSDLGDDRAAWDALVANLPLPSPFLRSWWLESAARHEPTILLVHDGNQLVGGVALEVDRRLLVPRVLVLGAALAPDHVDLVAAPGREHIVADAFSEWRRELGPHLLALDGLPATPMLAGATGVDATVVEHAPWTPLPASFDEYLQHRPAGLAKRIRRARNKLEAEGATYARALPAEIDASLDALRRLHAEVFGPSSLFMPYFDGFATVARRAVAAGEMVFHELRAGDEIVAVDVVFELAGRVSTYQGGRRTEPRWAGSGLVLQAAFLEDACRRGLHEFDHLRGVTDYKVSWAPELRPLTRLTLAAGVRGRGLRAAWEALPRLAALRARLSGKASSAAPSATP